MHTAQHWSGSRAILLTLTVLLLVIAASRIVLLQRMNMDYDDAWSIWQTLGTPAEILRWTPFDWPPLFYLTLGAWKALVGLDPLALRYFSVLAFLVGTACLYRAGRRMFGHCGALLAMLAYAALGYSLYLSLFIRGYILMLALLPLALWLTVRYFDKPSRTLRGSLLPSVLLAAALIGLFYTHYTAFFAFGLLGLYTLLAYPRRIWRWRLPVLLTGLAVIPHVIAKWDVFTTRTGFNRTIQLPPLYDALSKLSQNFAGQAFFVWLVLAVIATLLIVWRVARRGSRWPQAATLAIWVLGPLFVYLLQSRLGLFQDPRYMWWFLPGFGLWIGWGLSALPRRAHELIAGLLLIIMLLPDRLQMYQSLIPFGSNFRQLRQDYRDGDVLLIDPHCGRDCGSIESWDYFIRLYFPGGLHFVTNPDGYRRVWYIAHDWYKDPQMVSSLEKEHIPGEFFGPSDFLFRLYEGPPDVKGIAFENGMRFHGADIPEPPTPYGVVVRAGQKIRLRLWWSVDQAVTRDYSLGIYFMGEAGTLAELNGPPQPVSGPPETSRWVIGRYYVEERELTVPYPIEKGVYQIRLAVVQWWDNTKVPAAGTDADRLLTIQTINVQAW